MFSQILRKYLQLEDKICDRLPIYRNGVRTLAFDLILVAIGLLGMVVFGENIVSTVILVFAAATAAQLPWNIKHFKDNEAGDD